MRGNDPLGTRNANKITNFISLEKLNKQDAVRKTYWIIILLSTTLPPLMIKVPSMVEYNELLPKLQS